MNSQTILTEMGYQRGVADTYNALVKTFNDGREAGMDGTQFAKAVSETLNEVQSKSSDVASEIVTGVLSKV